MKSMAIMQILLQATLPVALSISASVRAAELSQSTRSVDKDNTSPYSAQMTQTATALSSGNVSAASANMASGYAGDSVEKWLSQFGTARVQLNVDDKGNWDDSAIDFLAPLYDSKKAMLFTQLGLRAPDDRVTGNFGLGVRTFYSENWMFGANVFFDDDFTGDNRRIGLGGEAWTNYLKLSANTYLGTTDWHSSRDFDDYYEKPADGFDVRAEGYLPAYPQLGAKVMYEQYYGDKVALFDKDDLQSNPSAITVGMSYTPVPLITAAVDYRRGQDSMDEAHFGINFRYNFGQTLSQQLSSSEVQNLRSLAGSRYDLVERNNEIVLQYKQKKQADAVANMLLTTVKDNSPADGVAANTVTVRATTSDGTPVRNAVISWSIIGGAQKTATGSTASDAQLSAESGVTDGNGNASVNITSKTAGQVTVQATSGDISGTAATNFVQSVGSLNLTLTQNNSPADGSGQNAGEVTVKDINGNVMSGVAINWSVNNDAKVVASDVQTNAQGKASVHYTNTKAGAVTLTASAAGKTASVNSAFVSQSEVSNVTVTTTTNNAQANNSATNAAQALVTDGNGQPMANASVTWSISGSATASLSSAATVTTNAQGMATVTVKDSVAETVTIVANAGGKSGSSSAIFTQTAATNILLTVQQNNATADGVSTNAVQAKVTDGSGQPVANTAVSWSVGGSAKATSAVTVNTNADGIATLSLSDSVAESVNVNASANGAQGQATVTFVPTISSVFVAVTANNALADGTSANTFRATVTSPSGQPVANASVAWSLSSSTASATTTLNATTDASGIATLSVTDTVAESVTATAKAGSAQGQATATFNPAAVEVSSVTVTIPGNNQPANGSATNQAQALVTDVNNQPLANVQLVWSITGSATVNATTPLSVTTDSNGIATLSFTDTVGESVTVTATAGGKRGQATATFASAAFGPLVIELEHGSNTEAINVATVRDGLELTVDAYPGMAEGDQITASFKVTGVVDPDSPGGTLLPDITLPVHTVMASEVGQPIVLTFDGDGLLGFQGETTVLTGTGTAIVVRPSTQQQISDSTSRVFDTW
ncbi:TPA: Ig-like domain-containing protein [Salmonella enterica]|nr:invasin/intimin [Salmonella enterica subsp. salamae]ECJ2431724.1 invasin/intimin [Salmonella enterica subsp. salamae]EDB1777682.1 invasin/intimin [Salmonella enterica subsp. salamae]EDZ7161634.1 invasin/intimin [Salmonella enterica subsp. salamae]MJK49478.1 invasin/intimin [Salmonella enterica subsp. salamae]